jgi:hypothetical protein
VVAVRQPEQLLAQLAAGGQAKAADAADLVGPPALLMRLSATAGCQRSWPLKSRSIPQTHRSAHR